MTSVIRFNRIWTLAWLVGACSPAFGGTACDQLRGAATPDVEIVAASSVQTGAFSPPKGKTFSDLPAFCRVVAILHPSRDSAIGIELWMPEANWNGRLEGTGNGGFAGNIAYGALADGVKHGYAAVNTDMGMATPPGSDATVFIGRPERWKDWGYRATHEMTAAAKRLTTAFYKRTPAHNYFVGCSTGGEQAWMEAQRYPDDYDGIVSGAPANNRTEVHESVLWNFMALHRNPQVLLSPEKVQLLANAVTNACDRLDGVADGIINDPSKCSFDPDVLRCSGADDKGCLTTQQVAAARALYAGPVNRRTGKQIYPGLPKGSEAGWNHFGAGAEGGPPFAAIFKWVFGNDWDWRTFDFDQSAAAVDSKLAADLNATSLNLKTFLDHGHKLLVYHGWSDWLVAPGESINYYNALATHFSEKGLNDFYRLYMVPGMEHCGGGVGPNHFDSLDAVIEWVEKGHAPDKIIASRFPENQSSGSPVRTRPLCPYPQVAHYSGKGNVDNEASFGCVTPSK